MMILEESGLAEAAAEVTLEHVALGAIGLVGVIGVASYIRNRVRRATR